MEKAKEKPRPKGQHYVPRMMLEHFVGSSPKNMVWVYDLDEGIARPSKPSNTAKQSNLYSPVGPDGDRIDMLEDAFSQLESAAKEPYLQLLAGEIPTGNARAEFSLFVAMQYLRSPRHMRSVADGNARMMHQLMMMRTPNKEALASLHQEMGQPLTDEQIDRQWAFIRDPSRYGLNISLHRGLIALGAAPEIANIIENRGWYLFRGQKRNLVTSDNPVIRYVPPEYHSPNYGDGGFAHNKCEVSIPLSSECLLMIAERKASEGEYSIMESQMMELNHRQVQHCERYFFACEKDPKLVEIMKDPPERFLPKLSVGGIADEVEVIVKRKMAD